MHSRPDSPSDTAPPLSAEPVDQNGGAHAHGDVEARQQHQTDGNIEEAAQKVDAPVVLELVHKGRQEPTPHVADELIYVVHEFADHVAARSEINRGRR